MTPLDFRTVPKWVNQLGPMLGYDSSPIENSEPAKRYIEITASEFESQILPPGFPKTRLFGFGGRVVDTSSQTPLGIQFPPLGPTIVANRNESLKIKWINNITGPHLFSVDSEVAHAVVSQNVDPQSQVPLIPHGHGLEVPSESDGHPEAWFTSKGSKGTAYTSVEETSGGAVFEYPPMAGRTALYHDHTHGMTRLNVLAGLAGLWTVRDESDDRYPSGRFEMALALQDRSFASDGRILFPDDGMGGFENWRPEYFGDVVSVNGLVWPEWKVARAGYRVRIANIANARFFQLGMSRTTADESDGGIEFTVIGTEGGLKERPVVTDRILLAPGERIDLLLDFSGFEAGMALYLLNSANAPYPDGDSPDPEGVGQVMKITVTEESGPPIPDFVREAIASKSEPTFPIDSQPTNEQIHVLRESETPNGPAGVFLNGLPFHFPATEQPKLGTTEDWIIINLTPDAHPIHIHLAQHVILGRRGIDEVRYLRDWSAMNGVQIPLSSAPEQPDPTNYYTGELKPPEDYERGWKDTSVSYPGEALVLRIRWAPRDADRFPFDATGGPGYVWHCHILDHEDMDMMRPIRMVA